MKFPNAGDIASTNVVSIDINDTIGHAIERMINSDHRDIVVIDKSGSNYGYYVLTAIEVLKIKRDNIKLDDKISRLSIRHIPVAHKDNNVLDLLKFLDEITEYICVVNQDNTLYGLITHTDITSNIDPQMIMDNYTVADLLRLTRRVRWIHEDMITNDVLTQMYDSTFDSVVVVKEQKPIGILTTKDVVQLIKDNSDLSLPVKTYMTSPVDVVYQEINIRDALEFIKLKHYKRLIIVDKEGKIKGILTQKELISLTYNRWSILMKEHQEELKEINNILQAQNKEYELMASVDSLTGLYNRYKFKQLFNSSLKTMIQRRGIMSLLILDIDHFKSVNDTYGHNIGDQVLKSIAKILQQETREIDIVCRWGGEEFVILLPTADREHAYQIAQKIRLKIEATEMEEVGHITASFGVAGVFSDSFVEEVLEKADKALYRAKAEGRNCVRVEDEE